MDYSLGYDIFGHGNLMSHFKVIIGDMHMSMKLSF